MNVPVPFETAVFVTQPLLPALDRMASRLQQIWDAKWLTNDGAQTRELSGALAAFLKIPHVSLTCNGTAGLLIACRALQLKGEVIVTPFTFSATVHALAWAGLTPVFADIDPVSMTLSPEAAERAITPRTSALLGVHVYGIPCDVEGLARVAEPRGLKLLYDAAHAFGVATGAGPISSFGDLSMFSFHATKLFHSAEGGALATRDPDLAERFRLLRNFGIRGEFEVPEIGVNAKMSELHAALGAEVLPLVPAEQGRRAVIAQHYRERLGALATLSLPEGMSVARPSYQYFPVRVMKDFAGGGGRDRLYEALRGLNILVRKYFFPLCSRYPTYSALPSASPANLPEAHRAAEECLCLPFHGGLSAEDVDRICDAIVYIDRTG